MADPMDDSDLFFSSPSKTTDTPQRERPKTPSNKNALFDAEEVREAALKRELEGVRNINEVIEGVIGTLERAKGNMGTVSQTVTNASTLLNTWARILSQTEHSQRLILDPNWKGATQDLQDIEAEALQQQMLAERRAAEEERRREERQRKLEEEERQRQAGTSTRGTTTRGTRGRGRGFARGSAGSSFVSDTSNTSGLQRTRSVGSGIGRGSGSTRGRGRGVR
ncbi:putative dash complex subunit duo1 protein [Phaeoacremonium minimum UCRPA7]|uniref:DASH complex subunit DUO1 n=1 Tax=Phaeoacremonium minimum (strain UCR-PA7) TaxID=1286976 RepID=R8BWC9_PHAM7|nr:putative dash complex subunit duo1 protein [Phaeoacremonium minimum UCRPA7]EOO03681.1 putative dash complex subunit duo1 protein [Phaeoacremonium minimum UCRPA7]